MQQEAREGKGAGAGERNGPLANRGREEAGQNVVNTRQESCTCIINMD